MKQKTKQKKKKQQRQRHYIFLRLDTQIRSTVAGVLNWHEPAAAKWSVYRCLDDVATLRQESAESEAETCRLCCCSYPSLRSLLNLQPGGTSLMLSLYILQVDDDDDDTRGRRWSCRRSWRGMAIGLPLCMWGACVTTQAMHDPFALSDGGPLTAISLPLPMLHAAPFFLHMIFLLWFA